MISFKEISDPRPFFEVLPPDWQEGIVPFWPEYQETTRVFVLEENGGVLGGGLLFATVSPDTMAYRSEAQQFFDRGYLYIAFLFFSEKYRGRGLGSAWLAELARHLPGQPFWLSIEEESLRFFYEKNGYQVVKKVLGEYGSEIILTHENARPA